MGASASWAHKNNDYQILPASRQAKLLPDLNKELRIFQFRVKQLRWVIQLPWDESIAFVCGLSFM